MAKKKKTRHYTKKELAESKARGEKAIVHELAGKLMNGDSLSQAEKEAAATILAASRPAGSYEKINLSAIPGAQDYIFLTLFLAYYGDLEGQYGIIKFSGDLRCPTKVATIEEKQEDVIRLNEFYEAWKKNFSTNRHKDQLMNLIINEVNNDLDIIDKLSAAGKITKEDQAYRRKGTILLSKFLYLRVKRIFEDIGAAEIPVSFNGRTITIDQWTTVHILNRHYAAAGKHYDSEKSFHKDQNLKFFEDPTELKNILELIGSNLKKDAGSIEYIPFKLNGTIYAVHTKKLKVNPPKVRIQTFYPIERTEELSKIHNEYNEVWLNDHLAYFSPKGTS